MGPSPRAANLWIALLCLIWGSTWFVIRGGLDDLPPLTSAAARFLVAGLAMAVVAQAWAGREGGGRPPAWLWLVLGTCNFAISYGIVYTTETVLPSGLVALLWGVFPMLQALAAHLYLPGERMRRAQWFGMALGLAGLAMLFATDLRSFGARGIPAALVLFVSPLVSVVGNTLVKRHGGGTSSLVLNRNAMVFGAVLLSIAAGACESQVGVTWTGSAIATVLYLALIGTVVTFGLYFWLMRYIDAQRLSLIAYVTPAVALTCGSLFRGEPLRPSTLAGAGSILAGVVLVVRGHRGPRAREQDGGTATTSAPS